MSFELITLQQLHKDVINMVPEILRLKPSCIIPVPRSGLLPATILSTELNIPLWQLPGGERERSSRFPSGEPIIVDDTMGTGAGMMRFIRQTGSNGVNITGYKRVVVYATHPNVPAEYHRVVESRIMQWNLFNKASTQKAVVDMDGVFCHDPKPFDDDGEAYGNALRDGEPKYLPPKVNVILTNRIEKWRKVTADWLERHGVHYNALVMRPEKTAQERRAKRDTAEWKAARLREMNPPYMIESHDKWAEQIHKLWGGPCISVESWRVWQ